MLGRDILIVEEDHHVGELLRQVFVTAGYACEVTSDGREGLDVFRRSQPALIVTERMGHVVPGAHPRYLSGVDLLLQVRQEDPDVAVIVLASGRNMRPLIDCLKLGADAYLVKPIYVDELMITVERALEHRRLLREHRKYELIDPLLDRDVLIVMNNGRHRERFQRIFRAAGYNCVLASDGDEAFQMFCRWRPPLVVTDLNMPSVRGGGYTLDAGLELLDRVGHQDPLAAVIVLSAGGDEGTAVACLKRGAYAYFSKPMYRDELLIAAARALERRQLLIARRERETAQGRT